jgi:hypothetical protein
MCIAGVRSSGQMGHPTINGNEMTQPVHCIGVRLLAGLVLLFLGCSTLQPTKPDIPEPRVQETTPVRDRGQELATLRAELAATKIAAAKKEAELLELRALVQQLRLENAESRQAFLELRDQAEQRQRDLVKARETPERQAKAQSQDDLTVLKDTVMMLAQELGQLKQDLAKPVAKEKVVSMALTMNAATVPDSPSTITVQPGDTLASLAKRHRTTVEVLRKLNVLNGDILIVGRALVLPMSQQP